MPKEVNTHVYKLIIMDLPFLIFYAQFYKKYTLQVFWTLYSSKSKTNDRLVLGDIKYKLSEDQLFKWINDCTFIDNIFLRYFNSFTILKLILLMYVC